MNFKKNIVYIVMLMLALQIILPSVVLSKEAEQSIGLEDLTAQSNLDENKQLDAIGIPQITETIPTSKDSTTSSVKEKQDVEIITEDKSDMPSLNLSLKKQKMPIYEGTSFTLEMKGTLRTTFLVLPEGISFNKEENKKIDGTVNETLSYKEDTRELIITNLSEESEFKVNLTADEVGDYKLQIQAEDKVLKSEEVLVTVKENKEIEKESSDEVQADFKLNVVGSMPVKEFANYTDVLQLSVTMSPQLGPNQLKKGTIDVNLPDGLTASSTPPSSNESYTVKYNPETNIVSYNIVDGLSTGSTLSLPIQLMVSGKVTSEKSYSIGISSKGTIGDSAVKEESSIEGIIAPFAAKEGTMVSKATPGYKFSTEEFNISGQPGVATERPRWLIRAIPGFTNPPLSFENLVWEIDTNVEGFKGTFTGTTSNKYMLSNSQQANTEGVFRLTFGPKTGSLFGGFDLYAVGMTDKAVAPGLYKLPMRLYDIQDGKKIIIEERILNYTVNAPKMDISYATRNTSSTVKAGSTFTNRTQLNFKSPKEFDYKLEYDIDDKLSVESIKFMNVSLSIQKYDYLVDDSTEWKSTTKVTDIYSLKDSIKKLNITIKGGTLVLPEESALDIRYHVNDGVVNGTVLKETYPKKLIYYDQLAEKDVFVESKTTADVTVVDKYVGPANLKSGYINTIGNFGGIKYNGDSVSYQLRLGGTTENPANSPYAFFVVPKGVDITYKVAYGNTRDGFDFFTNVWGGIIDSNSDVITTSKVQLNDGSTMYMFTAKNTEIMKSGTGLQITVNNNIKNVTTGKYEVRYGFGDGNLPTDNANKTTLTPTTEIVQSELSNYPEIQYQLSKIGVENKSFLTGVQKLTIGEQNGVDMVRKVQGSEDKEFVSDLGTTFPGKNVKYLVSLTNTGSVKYEGFEVVDILPLQGDTNILNKNNIRNAADTSFTLTSSIKIPIVKVNGVEDHNAVSIEYNTSNDPLVWNQAGEPAGTGNNWITAPSDMNKVRAYKVTSLKGLNTGDVVTLEFEAVVPSGVTTIDKIAYNTIAYRATKLDGTKFANESGPLGIQRTTPKKEQFLLGNIYSDLNENGSNDNELGVNGVKLTLFGKKGSKWAEIETVETSSDETSNGKYSFVNLDSGMFKIRVKKPENGIFVTKGKNKIVVDSEDSNFGWLTNHGSQELTVDEVNGPKSLEVDGGIKMETPILLNMTFVDKNGININAAAKYMDDTQVALQTSIGSAVTSGKIIDGKVRFKDFNPEPDTTYKLVLSNMKQGLVFSDKNLSNTDFDPISSEYTLTGLELGLAFNGEVYVTDKDLPTNGVISLIEGSGPNKDVNPTSAKVAAKDSTTDLSYIWTVSNGTNISYTGTGSTVEMKNYLVPGNYTIIATASDAANNSIEITKTFIVAGKPKIKVVKPAVNFFTNDGVTEAKILEAAGATVETEPTGVASTIVTNTANMIMDNKVAGVYTIVVSSTDANGMVAIPEAITVTIKDFNVMVSYMVDGIESLNTSVVYNKTLIKPEDPIKFGYSFKGWSKADGTFWDFGKDKVSDMDFILRAKFVAEEQVITFDTDGGTAVAPIKKVTGEEVNLTTISTTKAGYTFEGWYVGEVRQESIFQMPAGGLVLTAKWSVKDQIVSFNTMGGTTIADKVIKTDETLDIGNLRTTKAGYTLSGWTDTTGKAMIGVVTIKDGGLTLTAHWTADDQIITFDMNGGSPQQEPVIKGTDVEVDIDRLIKPVRTGYSFVGWFEGTTQISGKFSMPIGGKTLVANWKATEQKVTFDSNGGSSVDSIRKPTGTDIDLSIAITTKAGYNFSGWFNGVTECQGTIKMPAEGMHLTAHWTVIDDSIPVKPDDGNGSSVPGSKTTMNTTKLGILPQSGEQVTAEIGIIGLVVLLSSLIVAWFRKKSK